MTQLAERRARVLEMGLQGLGAMRISIALGVGSSTITRDLAVLRKEGKLAARSLGDNRTAHPPLPEREKHHDPIIPGNISPQSVGYRPALRDDAATTDELKAEIASLRDQLTWIGHADTGDGIEGGTITINLSDWHLHDAKHLPTALASCEAKTVAAIRKFKPRRLRIVENGDVVPGRGIYKQQLLEAVLPRAHQQISAGAIRFLEFVERVADAANLAPSDVPIWATPGNHDYSEGEETAPAFVFLLRMLGMNATYCGKYHVLNCADKGVHSILFFHGFGHSQISPSAPSLISETLKLCLKLANDYGFNGRRKIRRVTHGHTHFRAAGIERAAELPFDVTGGFQRYDRVQQGHNERPTGWYLYFSPRGSEDVIPMTIEPEREALASDMENVNLQALNMQEASRCLLKFTEEAEKRGVASDFWKQARENQMKRDE